MEKTKALVNYHMAGRTEQAQIISNDSLTYWSIYNLQINPFLIQAGWLASPSFGWLFKWVYGMNDHIAISTTVKIIYKTHRQETPTIRYVFKEA